MNWLNILLTIVTLAATSGAALAVFWTFRRAKAERDYITILHGSSEAEKLRHLYAGFLADGHLSEEELARLVQGLEQLAKRMPADERGYIVNALKQSSLIGRERYINKVIQDSVAA